MAAILPYLRDGVFSPDDIKAMSMALDDICTILNLPDSAGSAREVLAERIIDLARGGECNPAVLRDRVLHELDSTGQMVPPDGQAEHRVRRGARGWL